MPLNISGSIVNSAIVSTLNYKSIVTRGSILHLDAGALDSYPQTGTTLFDLTTNANNGTLTNGPTFSTDNGGIFVFDGTNDYINTTYNSSYDFSNANFSIESWINSNTISNGASTIIGTRATYGTNERSFELYVFNNTGTPYIWFGVFNGSWTYVNNSSLTNIEFSKWFHITATSDGAGNGRVYVNSVLRETNSSFNTGVSTTTVPFQIGAFFGPVSNGSYFNGKIANTRLYNRALSATEISQNFNAQRSRFGI
jgi:hypothetical protein